MFCISKILDFFMTVVVSLALIKLACEAMQSSANTIPVQITISKRITPFSSTILICLKVVNLFSKSVKYFTSERYAILKNVETSITWPVTKCANSMGGCKFCIFSFNFFYN